MALAVTEVSAGGRQETVPVGRSCVPQWRDQIRVGIDPEGFVDGWFHSLNLILLCHELLLVCVYDSAPWFFIYIENRELTRKFGSGPGRHDKSPESTFDYANSAPNSRQEKR